MKNNKHQEIFSWQKEINVESFIPYKSHINENTIVTKNGDLLKIIKLDGVAHESADHETIEIWKNQLNILFRNIATNRLSIWTHIVRKKINSFPNGEQNNLFDQRLNEKYKKLIEQEEMFINHLYITLTYKANKKINSNIFSLFSKESNKENIDEHNKNLEELNKIIDIALSSLYQYKPKILSCYKENKKTYSQPLEFLHFLLNGEHQKRLVNYKNISQTLLNSRLFFGKDVFEIKGVSHKKFGAMLSIMEYPEHTDAGLLNALLSAPYEFILTQSFNFITKPVAIELVKRQVGRMRTTDDLAVTQTDQLHDALDELVSNRFVFGQHHINICVFSDKLEQLKENVSSIHAVMADTGMVIAREDWALASAYWSQLPENNKYRPRPAPITSINFAGFNSLHNYPSGDRIGNQWGNAVTIFKTSSNAPYYFNFHEHQESNKKIKKEDEDKGTTQKSLGNTLIVGASGSGKTVLQGMLMSQAKKYNPTQVVFDKDRGLEIFIRASGGIYLPLSLGKKTGFNPFQIEDTKENILFLSQLIKTCCGGEFTASQDEEIQKAVEGVMSLTFSTRRINRCLDFLDPVAEDSPYERLSKWCGDGELNWIFDNPQDELKLDGTMFGFDVTDFLDNKIIRTPIIMYLFHRIESLIDGRRLMIFVDEFWKLLLDSYFEEFAQNKQKVIRKQNGIMIYATQSAKDVLKSPIAHTLIEQCATFIFMPNPKASKEDYVNGFNLTEREFDIIKNELQTNSRGFLIKKGHSSVVAYLNLKDFDDELAVISGTTDNIKLVEKIIKTVGNNPTDWLPLFHKERKYNV